MNAMVLRALALIVPLVIAIVFHEVAHGLVAARLGDPTARLRGRLSLNPLRHVDPIGTVLLPGALMLMKLPVFGWARPVPVDPRYFADPRRGMMVVGAAGPAMNLLLAAAGAVITGLAARVIDPHGGAGAGFLFANLVNFIAINVFLALFNLLPLPPFDGSHIVSGLLPAPLGVRYARLWRYGFALMVLVLVVLPQLTGFSLVGRFVMPPFDWLAGRYFALAEAVAGHPLPL